MADLLHVASCTVCGSGLGYCFDGSTSTISTLPYSGSQIHFQQLAARRGHALAAVDDDGHLLLTGGCDGGHLLNDAWVLSAHDAKIAPKPCSPLPAPRAGHSSIACPQIGTIFVYGGEFESIDATESTLISYDVKADSWKAVPSASVFPEKRFLHAAACARELMVVYGGLSALRASLPEATRDTSMDCDEELAEDWLGDLWVCVLPARTGLHAVWLQLDTSHLPKLRRPQATCYGENAVLIRGESDGAFATHFLVTLSPLSVRQACVRDIAHFRVHDVAFVRPNLLCSVGACGSRHRTQVVAAIPIKPVWLPPPPDASQTLLNDLGALCCAPFLCAAPFRVPRSLAPAENLYICNAIDDEPVFVYAGTDPAQLEQWLQAQWNKAIGEFEATNLDLLVHCGTGLTEEETYDGPAATGTVLTSAQLLSADSEVIRRQILFDSHASGNEGTTQFRLHLPETPAAVFRLVRDFFVCRRALNNALWRLPVSRLVELWFFCAVYGIKDLRDLVEVPLVHACRRNPALWNEVCQVAEGHSDSALGCQAPPTAPHIVSPVCH